MSLFESPPTSCGGIKGGSLFTIRPGRIFLLLLLAVCPVYAEWTSPPAIWVPPGKGRPFLLANRNGTYYYGSTSEESWDSGWMGLWVDRKRVMQQLTARDATGTAIEFGRAHCRVETDGAGWSWGENPPKTFSFGYHYSRDTLEFESFGVVTDSSHWLQRWSNPIHIRGRESEILIQVQLPFAAADSVVTRAHYWAWSHLFNLLAENDSLLYAGIPWFNEGWGRDTFISLPGFLVTGHSDVARKLIIRFANWIDRDPESATYGRIPNRVRLEEEIAYNTADGTPWWIRAIYEYGLYSGDITLWRELFLERRSEAKPWAGAGRIALNGAMLHSDSLGFLTHADQETWMDAVGTTGCVTPRGNRAVEIQALHYTAFDCAIKMSMAADKHEFNDDVSRWKEMRTKIERNFLVNYLTPAHDGLRDHLNADNTPDSLFRPNQLFAATVPITPLLPSEIRHRLLARVMEKLIQRHGVMSLSPDDELFHPYHMHERYPKDDAYHNGIVWVWLSGPAKTALRMEGRTDLALELANYEASYLLNCGMVGSLPELFDAMPRAGEKIPRQSGCTSQAWSLAEFLRTLYQDILGIRPVLVKNKIEPFWFFDPRIPEAWGETKARVNLSGVPLLVTMQNFGDSMSVTLNPQDSLRAALPVKMFDEQNGVTGMIEINAPVHFVYVKSNHTIYSDGYPTSKVTLTGWPYDEGAKDLAFSKPLKMRDWPALRPPEWEELTTKQILATSEAAETLVNESDPVGDDRGDGDYAYPLDEHFEPGILDITRFAVGADKRNYYFTLEFANLVQPGWHPEYGFQLTYAAICLHDGNGTRHEVGANSNYVLNKESGASRIIYVGGGLRIEDERGKTLATFSPMAPADAFGDTTTSTISFALPKKLFPKPDGKWAWTVLVGAQDDHGGAGMGEFRAVKPNAEQWSGGGNEHNGSNVYDLLRSPS